MSFTNYRTPATVKRLTAYSSDKSSYSAVSGTIYGTFNPIAPDMNQIALGIISQAYSFDTDGDQDIQDNDVLTIAGVDYGVKGTALYDYGSLSILKCVLEKTVKA